MSFSGGVYTLPGPALSTGEIVSATENNQFRNDVATAFNLTFLRNGTSTATANLPMGGYKLTGLGAATTSGDALSYGAAANVTTITISSDATLSGGTANGVAYLNGSKVLTTGSALTFDGTNLTVGGAYQSGAYKLASYAASGNQGISIFNGGNAGTDYAALSFYQAGSPTATIYTNSNNLTFNAAAGSSVFQTAGSEQMRLTSTGLGIGTSSPNQKLSIGVANTTGVSTPIIIGQVSTTTLSSINHVTENSSTGLHGLSFSTFNGGFGFSEKMRLDSSGNLGLGVTPSAWAGKALQVSTVASYFQDGNGGTNIAQNCYEPTTGAYKYILNFYATRYEQQSGSHRWYTAPSGTAGNAITFTQAMTLDASGNLGVGTASPAAKLDVNGNVYVRSSNNLYTNGIYGYDSDVNISTNNSGTNVIKFSTGASAGSERMRIDSSGKVGIGTSSPGYPLEVNGDVQFGSGTGGNIYINGAGGTSACTLQFLGGGSGNPSWDWGTYSAPNTMTLGYWSSGSRTERMRIDSSGNLLVGTTTASGKFTLGGSVGNVYIDSTGTNIAYTRNGTNYFIANGGTSAVIQVISNTNGVVLNNGATSWTAISDETKKDIIEPITDAANKVSTLRAIIGKYKTDEEGTRRSFLIAQDVQKVLPEAVSEIGEEDKSLGLSYTDVIPLLVAAIQELEARVKQLEGN